MALLTFTPPVDPSPGTGFAPEISLNETPFGDGYTQSSPNGINHIRQTLTLKWEGLTNDDRQAINDFFTAHKGVIPFLYTHPQEGVVRKYTCKVWSGTFGVPQTFTATLKQDFSLVS